MYMYKSTGCLKTMLIVSVGVFGMDSGSYSCVATPMMVWYLVSYV